ncbi:MAG: type I-B CRISPR-associated protein Cas7/Cst2/DevR [Paludibacteraceae bacterium]|nr:type I-B CRISPR-associated protein Cas7/Cst2/DevR [Paludibacteraceae bacterium]
MEANNNGNNNNHIPNITMTVIFEGSALNRNEKIGGNILSVKKLNVNGEEKTYLSKGAIRHYLFNTLVRAEKWKEAKIEKAKDVLQFNITADDILTCEELDVFGYMNTTQGQTRKTPLHITKAVSLFPYEQDMGMYANHDMVRRAKEQGIIDTSANPNPFNKEEHTSFYKITFTIDSDKLGEDKWIVSRVDIENNSIILKNEEQKEEKDETSEGEKEEKNAKKGVKKEKSPREELIRSIAIKNVVSKNRYEVKNGFVEYEQLQNKKYLVRFLLSPNEKVRRIRNILETIQNGLIAHTSSESNTIVPIFTIISDVKVPSPIFHPFIDVKKSDDGNFEVIGIEDAVKNGWLEGNIYIKDCARLKAQIPSKLNKKDDWDEFLKSVNLPNNVNDESSTN